MGVAWRACAKPLSPQTLARSPALVCSPGFADLWGLCGIATGDDTGLLFPTFPAL